MSASPLPERFSLEGQIASGGMGVVYAATDRATGARVAVKVLHQGLVDDARFERESASLAALADDCIVRYVAHGRDADGRPFLAMEWLEGEDLASRLARGPLSGDETLVLAKRLARGLEVVHTAGLVHRDVKPENVFLVNGELSRAKLLDFGLARRPRLDVVTALGRIVGTPAYMAPEQIRGQVPDPRVDVFALGCVLYHALAGAPPFTGGNTLQLLTRILLEEPAPLEAVAPSGLAPLIGKMMAKERFARPPDGHAVLQALDAVQRQEPRRSAPPEGPAPRGETLCALLVTLWLAGEYDSYAATVDAVARQAGASVAGHIGHGTVLTFEAKGSSEEQAILAVRTGIELVQLPGLRASLAMVHPRPRGLSDAIERAVAAPGQWPRGAVLVDDVALGLLPSRFAQVAVPGGTAISAERDALDLPRSLLGRVTPFIGRDAERAALARATTASFDARDAAVIALTGDAGIGKSRVRQETLRSLAEVYPDLTVHACHGDPARRLVPLSLLGGLVRRLAGLHVDRGEPASERLLARVEAVVPGVAAQSIARALGHVANVSFPSKDASFEAALGDPGMLRDRIQLALVTFFAAEALKGPLLLVLEDLQFADEASLARIASVLTALPGTPVVCWAISRDRTRLEPHFERTIRQEIHLRPLDNRTTAALLQSVLAQEPEGTLEEIARCVAGNPLVAEETARLFRDRGGGMTGLWTPVALYEARLSALPSELREVLLVGAVIGQRCYVDAIAEALQLERTIVDGRADELVRCEWLVDQAVGRYPGVRELSFRAGPLRDAALAAMSPEATARTHEPVARWLEHVGEPDPLVVASHFDAAGLGAAAAPYFAEAARRALALCELATAVVLAERGLAGARERATRGLLYGILAEARRQRGEHDGALEAAVLAMQHLDPKSALSADGWFQAMGEAVTAAGRLRRLDDLTRFADELIAMQSERPSAEHVVACARAATVLEQAGAPHRADALHAWLDVVASRFSDAPVVRARVQLARAARAQTRGRLDEHRAWLREAARAFEAANDARNVAGLEASHAHACLELGDHEEAIALSEGAIERARALNLLSVVAPALLDLALALGRVGRYEEAIGHAREAKRLFERSGDDRLTGAAHVGLARLLLDAGKLAEAEAEAEAAKRWLERVPVGLSQALAASSAVALARGQIPEAVLDAQRSVETLDGAKVCDGSEVALHLALTAALLASGDDVAAGEAAARGARTLDALASRITDPAARARFIERVPEHARMRDLAKELR